MQIIAKLGWKNIISYKLRRMSLHDVAMILSARVNANIEIKNISSPQLAIDVDSKEDYELMRDFLRETVVINYSTWQLAVVPSQGHARSLVQSTLCPQ